MRPAAWLALGAAPTFTIMAAVTAVLDAKAGVAMCGLAPSPVGGMTVMYLLMAGFHLGPWLRRAAR